MKLNCDLGEGYGAWKMTDERAIMPFIDMANIACGYHAGDPVTMRTSVQTALEHDVQVGAHPAYPDLQGFGRRSMALSSEEIVAIIHYQLAALDGITRSLGGQVSYVKPHGALYNDMMADADCCGAVFQAIASYHRKFPLVIQATPDWLDYQARAQALDIALIYEAFADRRYDAQGKLLPRTQVGAVLSEDETIAQAQQMIAHQRVTTAAGDVLSLNIDTLCVHGDSPQAIDAVRHIRRILSDAT